MSITFQSLEIKFSLKDKTKLKTWLKNTILAENKKLGDVNYIFCSDNYLYEMNQKYLNHDYLTDVITFDYCEDSLVSGDIFISVDRVKENAATLNLAIIDELHRIMIHGLLHLLGYEDKTAKKKTLMTTKEDFYLNILKSESPSS